MKSPFIYKEKSTIFFGDAAHCPDNFRDSNILEERNSTILTNYCEGFAQKHSLTNVAILDQVHGVDSLVVGKNTLQKRVTVCEQKGDFLITNQSSIALGVITGDCLPVVVYDKKNHAVGIAHAGWKGTVAGVVPVMVQAMKSNYGTQSGDVTIWFGPAARPCCYEVQQDFVAAIAHLSDQEKFLIKRDEKLFFDGTACNETLLTPVGIQSASLDTSYNVCTICAPGYYSHRRKSFARQVSFVWII